MIEQLEKPLSQVTLKGYAAKKFKDVSALAKTSFGITFCVEFQMPELLKKIKLLLLQSHE